MGRVLLFGTGRSLFGKNYLLAAAAILFGRARPPSQLVQGYKVICRALIRPIASLIWQREREKERERSAAKKHYSCKLRSLCCKGPDGGRKQADRSLFVTLAFASYKFLPQLVYST
jgi:hypothetical protein